MDQLSSQRTGNKRLSCRGSARVAGIVMTLLALLALYAMSTMLKHAGMQFSWVRTNCTIDHSALLSDGYGTDSLELRYHYQAEGSEYQGSLFELPSNVSRSQTFFRKELELLQPGVDVECFYNPASPAEVVLRKTTLGDAAFAIIPAIFLIIGLSALFSGMRAKLKRGYSPEEESRQCQELNAPSERTAAIGSVLFFSLFILAGIGYSWLIFGIPYNALRDTQHWDKHVCRIISSRVEVGAPRSATSGVDSDSATLDVRYEYTIDNRTFIGMNFNAGADRFMARTELERISDVLNSGSEVECFVDPLDPTRSVLNREMPLRMLAGLFPLAFSFAGLLGLLATGGGKRGKRVGPFSTPTLSTSRLKMFLIYCLLTIVWNGITTAVIFVTALDSNGAIVSILPLLLSIPFLLIGMLLILSVPWAFLQLFNPTTELELSSERIVAGRSFSLKWRIRGNCNRVRELKIELVPEWLVTTGDNQVKKVLLPESACIPPYYAGPSPLAAGGRAEFQIPDQRELDRLGGGAVLKGWKLSVVMKIPWYPDSLEEHRLDAGEDEALQ